MGAISPFRYPGGKSWFVPFATEWFIRTGNISIIEPFAGGASVTLSLVKNKHADHGVLVERDDSVAAVWEIILHRSDFAKLQDKILSFDMKRQNVVETLDQSVSTTLDRAFHAILRNRVSHGGIMAPGAGLVKDGENGRGISSRWYPGTLCDRIQTINDMRGRIEFIHGDAFEIIAQRQGQDTAWFIDPPYTAAGKKVGSRLYAQSSLDHSKLFSEMAQIKGDLIATYDDLDDIKILAERNGLFVEKIAMRTNKMVSKNEIVITNSKV